MKFSLYSLLSRLSPGWIRNSAGKPDAMLSIAVAGFFVSSVCVIVSLFTKIQVKDFSLEIKDVSETLILGFLSATLGSYILRRNKKDQIEHIERLAALGKEIKIEEKVDQD